MADYKYALGIDLGTTNTLAYYMEGGKLSAVTFKGNQMLPSALYVDKQGKQYVGWGAINRGGKRDRKHLVLSSKTYIGDNEVNKVYDLYGKTYTPTDVATEILKEVRNRFIREMELDDDEKIGAVITVPAYFNNNQISETRKAGFTAGFEVLSIEPEPVMAAVAAARHTSGGNKVFVADIGGGTFDLSVLAVNEAEHTYEAIALDGDPRLGGDDFDDALEEKFIKIVEDQKGINLGGVRESGLSEAAYDELMALLRKHAKETKEKLTDAEEVTVDIPDLLTDYDFKAVISREQFDEICRDIYDKIFNRTEKFLNQNEKFNKSDIDKLVLVGGSCYIPYIRKKFSELFPNLRDDAGSERSMLVAKGAAHKAAAFGSGLGEGAENIVIRSIVPHSLGVMASDRKTKEKVLSKILFSGTPYGVGVTCENSREFTTTRDNQTEFPIFVYEAGNDMEDVLGIGYHKFYGSVILSGITPAPKETPVIVVKFSYDENQRLTVTATEQNTGKTVQAEMKPGEKPELPEASPVDLVVLVDKSGSMRGQEMTEAKTACKKLVSEMIDFSVHRMGLIAFNDSADIRSELTHNENNELERAVEGIEAEYGTNMIAAFDAAENMLRNSGSRDRVVIMVTDGYPKTITTAQRLLAGGIKIYAIGVGDGIDFNFLAEMVGRENAYILGNMSELSKKFEEIVELITPR